LPLAWWMTPSTFRNKVPARRLGYSAMAGD
jgi:hypothetical protein